MYDSTALHPHLIKPFSDFYHFHSVLLQVDQHDSPPKQLIFQDLVTTCISNSNTIATIHAYIIV